LDLGETLGKVLGTALGDALGDAEDTELGEKDASEVGSEVGPAVGAPLGLELVANHLMKNRSQPWGKHLVSPVVQHMKKSCAIGVHTECSAQTSTATGIGSAALHCTWFRGGATDGL